MKKEFTPEELLTIASYDRTAKEWTRNHSTADFWASEFTRFKTYLPKGKILELGAGGGRDARLFIDGGYYYIGTDVSGGLLEQARIANPTGLFLRQSIYNLVFPKDYFDGFWASAVLLHIPKNRLKEALEKINHVTRKSGIGFISIKEGQGEKIEEDLEYGEKLFSYFSDEEFATYLYDCNFDVLWHQRRPMSEKTIWLTYLVETRK